MTSRHVAVYLRLSKKDDRSTSIDKQRRNTRALASTRFPGTAVVEYVDDGVSASKGRSRAGLDALLADVRAGKVLAVLVDTVDRLTRERGSRALWDVAEACEHSGADLLGASQEIDVVTAGGELTVGVLAAAARFEGRRTGERVKATNRLRAAQGLRALGGPPVWGLTREGARFVPDPERAPLLLDAVDRVIEGSLSIRGMAEEFTRRGIPTARGGATWSHRAVAKILRSPALAGMTPRDGDVLRADDGLPVVADDALLPVGRWQALQVALDARKVDRQPVTRPRAYPLLHGLAQCEEGHPLYRHAQGDRTVRYRCSTVGCTARPGIAAETLDAYVVEEVLDAVGHLDEYELVQVVPARDFARLRAVREEITRTTNALATARGAQEITTLALRLTTLREAEGAAEQGSTTGIQAPRATGRTIAQAYDAASTTEERRAVLAEYVDRVVVRRGPRGTPPPVADRVVIQWAAM